MNIINDYEVTDITLVSRTHGGFWRLTYMQDNKPVMRSYCGYPDEVAVLKQFLWENSDEYPYSTRSR